MAKDDQTLPEDLVRAVKDQRSVVFLGAGATKEAVDEDGNRPPNADELRDILAQRFFGQPMPTRDVMAVAEMAIATKGGQSAVFEEVRRSFDGFQPGQAHELLSTFFWRGIATTNYDLLIERSYGRNAGRLQDIIRFVKDEEPFIGKMQESTKPLPYIKLHGCLDHIHDPDIPLILSREQYDSYLAHRTRLFSRLSDMAFESTFIFVGYRLDDSHIRSLIYRISPDTRPRWFIVTPNADHNDVEFWETKNVGVVALRFGEFMAVLDREIPPLLRAVPIPAEDHKVPVRHFYVSRSTESESTYLSLRNDVTLIHSGMSIETQTPNEFYRGYAGGWAGIVRDYDTQRTVEEIILYEAILKNEESSTPSFYVLRGAAGSGKTIALKRSAYEASNDQLVLWHARNGALRSEVFEELYELTQRTIFLFIDEVGLYASDVYRFLGEIYSKSIPVVVISAERESDWNTYCRQLEDQFEPKFFKIGNLSRTETESLINLLDQHNCLGLLSGKPRGEIINAFMDKARADRQLLVALHELTQGIPFEEIILDEYERIQPEQARQLYLDIATMHQFGVPARAGPMSRISGINLNDYEKSFFTPLENIVRVVKDPYSRDNAYETRHRRVAEIVFRQVCVDDEKKVAQFKRILDGLDVGYSSDLRVLDGIAKGRTLANAVSDVDSGRSIFDFAMERIPNTAYLYQQRAIFEMNHDHGLLANAEESITRATNLDPHNRTIIHTEAELARRMAHEIDSELRKDALRRSARESLNRMDNNDRYAMGSRCKLFLDEIADLQRKMSESPEGFELEQYEEKVGDAEAMIRRSLQSHPDDPEILHIEAQFRTVVNEHDKALIAFERAWKAGPRGSGTAIRLAQIYWSRDRFDDAIGILEQELSRNPDDKQSHNILGKLRFERNGPSDDFVEGHLKKAFVKNDNNFEARFDLAQYYFASGRAREAQDVFARLDAKAPHGFRWRAFRGENSFTVHISQQIGHVTSVQGSRLFVNTPSYPSEIIGFRNQSDPDVFDEISVGDEIQFTVRFNRVGPVATNIRMSGC